MYSVKAHLRKKRARRANDSRHSHAVSVILGAMSSDIRDRAKKGSDPGSEPKSCWSSSKRKRVFDFLAASAALILLAPVLVIIGVSVKLSSRGPVLFRQVRMGRGGREFVIYKFRTMRVDRATAGPTVTKAGDIRLTPIGALLRRFKLDELPQLYNVLKGDMSLVGARPKLPHHQIYPLKYRPGITGASALAFRNEEYILHKIPHHALDAYQIRVLMPLKKELDDRYMANATFLSDLKLIWDTLLGRGKSIDAEGFWKFQHALVSLNSSLESPPSPPIRAFHSAKSA
jgi:lipopolysaccharide/colanic/teichoic acid biosynthesis glycosyltransferase